MNFCTSKTSKLSTKQIALCHDEVLRFEVAVDDANGVQARQCQQHVPHDVDSEVDLLSAAGSKVFTTEGKNLLLVSAASAVSAAHAP
jgi:hypothetical protein